MKLLLSLVSATALFVVMAHAQTSSTSTTTTSGTGTVTEFSPGSSLVLSTGSGEPVHYRFSKNVTYVTPDGKVVEASKIRKDSRVRVHYLKEGGDMVVDKVIVTE